MRKTGFWRYPSKWSFFRFDDRLLLILLGVLVGLCSGLAAFLLNRVLLTVSEELAGLRQ